MIITLSNGTQIEVRAIDIAHGLVDWRRLEGYRGDCQSSVAITDLTTAAEDIKAALELELGVV